MTNNERDVLEEVAEALDPVQWACSEVNKLLQRSESSVEAEHKERCSACDGSGEGGYSCPCSVCNGTGTIVVTADMAGRVLAAIERGEPVELFTAEEKATLRAALRSYSMSSEGRILLEVDAYCPSCGHNRDKSATSTIVMGDESRKCQSCGADWREISRIGGGTKS